MDLEDTTEGIQPTEVTESRDSQRRPTLTEYGQVKGRPKKPEDYDKEQISLLQLQQKLNAAMQCPAGKNQVYVLSQLKSNGRITKIAPQVCLDCKCRGYLGWRKRIDAEFIQKVCCGDPKRGCEAYQRTMSSSPAASGLHIMQGHPVPARYSK
jgi:hypothetical protein